MTLNKNVELALTKAGGKTLGGKPRYKFAWSADFTYLISNGSRYERMRVVAEDCWLLLKFELPEFWGTEEEWNANNYESTLTEVEVDGVIRPNEVLLTAGPYPSRGRYRNIMRIQVPLTMADGQVYRANVAPTIEWVEKLFPGVRDFLDLSTEEKAQLIAAREKHEKDELSRSFEASRSNYRGVATAKQVKAKEEAIERWLKNPRNVAHAQSLLAQRKVVN